MDFEKAYKEAFERAKRIHNESKSTDEKGLMEEVFTELRSTEDIPEDTVEKSNDTPKTTSNSVTTHYADEFEPSWWNDDVLSNYMGYGYADGYYDF